MDRAKSARKQPADRANLALTENTTEQHPVYRQSAFSVKQSFPVSAALTEPSSRRPSGLQASFRRAAWAVAICAQPDRLSLKQNTLSLNKLS